MLALHWHALHYTSPHLKKDGRQETNKLATQFLQLIKQVSDNRKIDVLELQNKLKNTEREKEAIEESKRLAETRLKEAVEKLETVKMRNEQAIHDYHLRLSLAPN